ncbi:OmpP1/FadL family transporter [Acinetobacter pseudolwoffii]|uniref:Transporter n=1 Tax=Acinetobacter pseudolwoffii TaxID=2053287 RepID=A0A2H9UPE6_9GAMM|nr:outer membrane protein transport protein [Acinetobacter pseudolwoffii]MCO8090266.1 outer membrane protein transport protein [Acinetobacter pseudolwoffii]PJI33582.1 transporter [Acinetobacter pseudolwoffii]HJE54319.1 outer membrane protein transport protein [Acinetobacter pseudolwoffii]
MKLNKIYSAILLSTLPLSAVQAAGLDRSGQSISAFLQPGNYAEAGISVLDPEVQGKDNAGNKVSDMAEDYYFPTAAIKIQATDKISLGLLYDQPFGADSQYAPESNAFATVNTNTGVLEGTSVEVKTNSITALIGYQPNENWNVYAGPVYQSVKAKVSLRGTAYRGPQVLGGYDIDLKESEAYGWLAGFAYSIPEIALKAAVTYRSEIKHELDTTETFGFGTDGALYIPGLTGTLLGKPVIPTYHKAEITTPQSVNIDLQSGIAKNTLAFANIRWVHWDQFAVKPAYLSQLTGALTGKQQNLVDYSDDQWSANVGLGRKFNNKWSGSASVGYDSGAGNPVTTLGPTEGYWNVGLGGQYSPAENYFIQAGVKYFWLGDATAQTGGNPVGEFEDNYAMGYGLKIGYRF